MYYSRWERWAFAVGEGPELPLNLLDGGWPCGTPSGAPQQERRGRGAAGHARRQSRRDAWWGAGHTPLAPPWGAESEKETPDVRFLQHGMTWNSL